MKDTPTRTVRVRLLTERTTEIECMATDLPHLTDVPWDRAEVGVCVPSGSYPSDMTLLGQAVTCTVRWTDREDSDYGQVYPRPEYSPGSRQAVAERTGDGT